MNISILLADGPRYTSFFSDFDTTFWSAILRIAEAIVAAAPFLVAGAVTAGLLRGMVGPERIRKMLGVGHWTGPLRAWGLGVLLPICSLGALPVARELRRSKIPSGTILSFVLVAPVLNPVSVIYGLSHIELNTLAYFAVGTFVVSIGIGMLWNHLISSKRDNDSDEPERVPRNSRARLAVAGDTAARSLVGPAFVDYGLALLAVGLLGALLGLLRRLLGPRSEKIRKRSEILKPTWEPKSTKNQKKLMLKKHMFGDTFFSSVFFDFAWMLDSQNQHF